MQFEAIKIGRRKRKPVDPKDVDAAEAYLKTRFPDGYREFSNTFGEGVLAGFVRVYPPWRIVNDLREWRRRIREYWLWEDGEAILSPKRAEQCIVIADTLAGDELIFHPKNPHRVFVLPHESGSIHIAGKSLLEAIDWTCTSGVLVEPFDASSFMPATKSSRVEIRTDDEPPAKPAVKASRSDTDQTVLGSPEETLTAFWSEYYRCSEDDKWDNLEWDAFENAALEILRKYCTNKIHEGRRIRSRGSSDYNPQHEEAISGIELKKNKAFVYTIRPHGRIRKNRWVLELEDGEWKIARRQEEGMKLDKYRDIAIC